MKTILAGLILSLSIACTDDLEVGPASAADAKAAEAPPATTSIDPLSADFDPEKAAPREATASMGHEHHGHDHGTSPADPAATEYTCPHHPEVVSDKPGVCPKCKMDLVPKKPEPKKNDAEPTHDHGAHP